MILTNMKFLLQLKSILEGPLRICSHEKTSKTRNAGGKE